MKKIILILFSVIAITALLFTGCVKKDFDEPGVVHYSVDFESNTTIDELKAMGVSGLAEITDDVIIKGTVIADDESGNFYKSIVIQDSTGGIQVSLDAYSLYNTYPIGQLVYIKCKDLYVGPYGGVVQLGMLYDGDIGRIPEPIIKDYLYKSDGGIPIEPELITFSDFNDLKVNTLVRFDSVQFKYEELGLIYAVYPTTTNRTLQDCNEKTVLVRTSGYATFAGDLLPEGNGSFVGVLSRYNSDYQVYIRNTDELDLTTERCGKDYLFFEGFDVGLGQMKAFNITGTTNTWFQDSYGGVNYAKMTGYYAKTYEVSEDWLITPAVDLSSEPSVSLNFRHDINYQNPVDYTKMKVMVSTNYDGISDPNTATWDEISSTLYADPTPNAWGWVETGDIDLSTYSGNNNVRIAFKYATDVNNVPTWEIDYVGVVRNN